MERETSRERRPAGWRKTGMEAEGHGRTWMCTATRIVLERRRRLRDNHSEATHRMVLE